MADMDELFGSDGDSDNEQRGSFYTCIIALIIENVFHLCVKYSMLYISAELSFSDMCRQLKDGHFFSTADNFSSHLNIYQIR